MSAMADTDETVFPFDVGGTPNHVGNVLDQLDSEIRFARGLVVAIEGLDDDHEDDLAGVRELADAHVRRLQSIRDGLDRLRPDAKRAKKAKRKGKGLTRRRDGVG